MIKSGSINVYLHDLLDDRFVVDPGRVEWGHRTSINRSVLEVRAAAGGGYDGYIDGLWTGYRADTGVEVKQYLLTCVALLDD